MAAKASDRDARIVRWAEAEHEIVRSRPETVGAACTLLLLSAALNPALLSLARLVTWWILGVVYELDALTLPAVALLVMVLPPLAFASTYAAIALLLIGIVRGLTSGRLPGWVACLLAAGATAASAGWRAWVVRAEGGPGFLGSLICGLTVVGLAVVVVMLLIAPATSCWVARAGRLRRDAHGLISPGGTTTVGPIFDQDLDLPGP